MPKGQYRLLFLLLAMPSGLFSPEAKPDAPSEMQPNLKAKTGPA